MAAPPARRDPSDQRLRHARPGRGPGTGRPRGGDEPGADRADRHARTRSSTSPQTEFVMNFLGQVNALPRPAGEGQGAFRLARARFAGARPGAAASRCACSSARTTSTWRTHRNGHPCFRAVVKRVHSAGPERAAGPGGRIGRAPARRTAAGALPRPGHHDRQPGLRHAPRGEGVRERRVKVASNIFFVLP